MASGRRPMSDAIRPAATVILTRPGPRGAEVLMGQRGAGAVFMPSKFVFPGGGVDPVDHSAPRPGYLDETCARRLGLYAPADAPASDVVVAAALRELLRPYQFTSEQARQIADNLDQVGMDIYSETQARLLIDRKHLVLTLNGTTVAADIRISADDLMVKVPNFGRLFFTETEIQPPYPDGSSAILIDRTNLQFPLLLRTWLPGDTFQPFGMHGQHQKVQDFLTNQKVSKLDKEQVRLLLNGDGTPIWVLGWRLDERFRVTNSDKNGLKITLIR